MDNITDQFLGELLELKFEQIPPSVLHGAKRCLIDYLGATYAGVALERDRINRLCLELSLSRGAVPVLGTEFSGDRYSAALVNGLSSHFAELDDGVISGIVHPGAPLFSAMLSYIPQAEVSGEDFLRGVVIGYEATVRLAESMQPGHKLLGYHATATCGALGAAIGVAVMTRCSYDCVKHAFSAAAITAAGTLEALEGESEFKPYNVGQGAAAAVAAVSLSRSGFKGPQDPLSGKFGLLQMMGSKIQSERLTNIDWQAGFAISRVYVKPYAACRYCHAPIDAALNVITDNSLSLENIDQIRVETYELAVKGHDHKEVANASSAKMSIPFSVAQAVVKGDVGPLGFGAGELSNQHIRDTMEKIEIVSSAQFTALFPRKTPAKVTITTKGGEVFSSTVDYPLGEPETPLSDIAVGNKFSLLANISGLSEVAVESILSASWQLPESMSQLRQLLCCHNIGSM